MGGRLFRTGFARAIAALAVAALGGCSANSYMGIPLAETAATPEQAEIQSLAKRARTGERKAHLELGIRFEEGAGVERDVARAEEQYILAASQSTHQTTSVPVNGSIVTERTSTGTSIWPTHPNALVSDGHTKLIALIRLCEVAFSPKAQAICNKNDFDLLRDLVRMESNFKRCRMQTELGNAGPNPFSFILNAIDTERRIETRNCILAADPAAMNADQANRVWNMWWAAKRMNACGSCEIEQVRDLFVASTRREIEDSVLWIAMWDSIERVPSLPMQVGTDWWALNCRSFRSGDSSPTTTEKMICTTIDVLRSNEEE
jgi:hypothetical protein